MEAEVAVVVVAVKREEGEVREGVVEMEIFGGG